MTTKDEKREALKADYTDAQGRGDRDAALAALTALQELDKPEKAVRPKKTETRKKG